jgi:uncharacterized protein (DUF2236 family)
VDGGYFPRGQSVLRRVHGARIVGLVYGQRSLIVQATHPLAFAGLMANTGGQATPFQRLVHTAKTMETVFFGTREEADRETSRVAGLHARVKGVLDEPAGPHPAGSTYDANDPEFLLWMLACLADSAEVTYRAFVRELEPDETERFWQDYLLLGELFGLPRAEAPSTYEAYRSYMGERLGAPNLYVTREARELGRTVAFDLPVPPLRRPGLSVINFAVLGLLPDRVRHLYGLEWGRDRQAAFEALARGLRLSARVTPARLRRGSSAGDYDVVARTERRRLREAA